jgi:hypothetical protein
MPSSGTNSNEKNQDQVFSFLLPFYTLEFMKNAMIRHQIQIRKISTKFSLFYLQFYTLEFMKNAIIRKQIQIRKISTNFSIFTLFFFCTGGHAEFYLSPGSRIKVRKFLRDSLGGIGRPLN